MFRKILPLLIFANLELAANMKLPKPINPKKTIENSLKFNSDSRIMQNSYELLKDNSFELNLSPEKGGWEENTDPGTIANRNYPFPNATDGSFVGFTSTLNAYSGNEEGTRKIASLSQKIRNERAIRHLGDFSFKFLRINGDYSMVVSLRNKKIGGNVLNFWWGDTSKIEMPQDSSGIHWCYIGNLPTKGTWTDVFVPSNKIQTEWPGSLDDTLKYFVLASEGIQFNSWHSLEVVFDEASFKTPVMYHDMETIKLTSPDTASVDVPYIPKIIFGNNGINDEQDVKTIVTISKEGKIYYTGEKKISNISAGNAVKKDFPSWTPPEKGIYDGKAIVNLKNDENRSNDTLEFKLNVIKPYVLDVATLGIYDIPSTIVPGGFYVPKARYKNNGTEDVRTYAILSIKDPLLGKEIYYDTEPLNLPEGSERTITFAGYIPVSEDGGPKTVMAVHGLSPDSVPENDTAYVTTNVGMEEKLRKDFNFELKKTKKGFYFSATEPCKVRIYDITGRKIEEKKVKNYDFVIKADGVYFVKVKSDKDKREITKKIVKVNY